MDPSRVIFGNIQYGEIIYAVAIVVIAIMVYAFIRRYKMWHLGKADSRLKGSLKDKVDKVLSKLPSRWNYPSEIRSCL